MEGITIQVDMNPVIADLLHKKKTVMKRIKDYIPISIKINDRGVVQ